MPPAASNPPARPPANPTFAGIEPASAPMFVVMQLVGAIGACVLVRFLYPATGVQR